MRVVRAFSVLRTAWRFFREHDGSMLSGAVAFYALLSIAPFGLLALLTAETFYGVEGDAELVANLPIMLGENTGNFVSELVHSSGKPERTGWTAFLGIGFMVVAASKLFLVLKSALNHSWGVRAAIPRTRRSWRERMAFYVKSLLRRRLIAFSMVLVFLAAIGVGTAFKALIILANRGIGENAIVLQVLSTIGSILVSAGLITIIFQLLPDTVLSWFDAFIGGLVTSTLTTLGSLGIGLYFAKFSSASSYGVAGAAIVVLLWAYYTAQMFFFGASFTRTWCEHVGRPIVPMEHAVAVVTHDGISPSPLDLPID